MQQADAVRQSVARIMTGLSRCIQRERPEPQLRTAVETAKEQVADQARRLTSGKPTGKAPAFPANARSAGAFLIRTPEKLIRMPLLRQLLRRSSP